MRPWLAFIAFLLLTAIIPAQQKGPAKPTPKKPLGNVTLAVNTGGHSSPVADLAFSGDGKKLFTLERREVHIWDVTTGQRERTVRLPYFELEKLAVSPDGKTLAVAGAVNAERNLPIWIIDVPSGGTRVIHPGIGNVVTSLAFSPDGKRLAYASWFQAGVWSLKANRRTHLLQKPELDDRSEHVAFGKDGNLLLVGNGHAKGSQYKVFDLTQATKGKLTTPQFSLGGLKGWEGPAAVAPDGSRFACWSTKNHVIHFWGPDGKKEKDAEGKPHTIGFTGWRNTQHQLQFAGPDQLIALGPIDDTTVRAYRINLKGDRKGKAHNFRGEFNDSIRLAAAPDGKHIAVTSGPGFRVLLCNLDSDKIVHRLGPPYPTPTLLAWSADSRAIAWGFTSPKDGKKQLAAGLNLATLEPPEAAQLKAFKDVHLKPAGWSIKNDDANDRKDKREGVTLFHQGKRIETIIKGPRNGHAFFKNAAGELRVLIGGFWGGRPLHLIHPETGKSLHQFGNDVEDFSVSPDRRFLLIARGAQVLEVHRLEGKPGLLLRVLPAGREWIAWTPQGYYAATPAGERLMGWNIKKDDVAPLDFVPAERFRARLYRPEVIRKTFELVSVQAGAKVVVGEKSRSVEQMLPPRCTLQILKDAGGKVTVKVSAEARVPTQPVVALRLLLNGRPCPDVELKEFDPPRAKAEAQWTVELPAGKSTLAVLARSEDASAISEVGALERGLAAQGPVLHVLAIGINDYGNGIPKLGCAVNDAQDLAKAFPLAKQGNLFSEVKTHLLLNQQASSKGIREQLAKLRPQLHREDVLVLTFAGHGVREGDDFYLLTAEAELGQLAKTSLSGKELRQRLRDLPCQVLLLLDACHSGAVVKNLRPATDDVARAFADDEVGVTVLAAAMGHQKALEQGGNGYFTAAIKEALAGGKDVPINRRDGRLYVAHLYAHVLDVVSDRSNQRQHPFLSLPSSAGPLALRQFARKKE